MVLLVRFQFLLGRLETLIRRAALNTKTVFQFLLGRLETKIGINLFSFFCLFQFLLGRLETFSFPIIEFKQKIVSIPLR